MYPKRIFPAQRKGDLRVLINQEHRICTQEVKAHRGSQGPEKTEDNKRKVIPEEVDAGHAEHVEGKASCVGLRFEKQTHFRLSKSFSCTYQAEELTHVENFSNRQKLNTGTESQIIMREH